MGVIKKLANINKYERGANYELGNSLSGTAVSTLFGTGGDSINVLEEYSGFAWKAINIRAEVLAGQDLFVERRVGDKWQYDTTHEFNEVLEGGEGTLDQSELLEAHEKSMCLYGESFWYYSKGERYGKPMAVYLLDPSAMTVMVAGNKVTGYVYQKDGGRITLETDEVDHFKIYDPRHPFRGTGPMQSAGWFIRSGRYVNTYVNNFLENNAIPAGVVVADSADDKDWTLFKEQWTSKYAGIDNLGKTGFVRGQNLQFIKTGMSLGDIDVEKVKNTSRDDIMVMFGVSKPMMAIFDDINRASAVTARQLFAITLTAPALMRLKRKISKKVAMWYGEQYRIGSTNPVPEDEETKLQAYDKGTNRWFTVNEAREAYGLEPILGGDVLQNVAAPAPKSLGTIKIRTKNNKVALSYEMKENFRSETEELQKNFEKRFITAVQPLLKDQQERMIEQLSPKKVVDAHMDVDKEAAALVDVLLPMFLQLAKEQGILAVNFAVNDDKEFEVNSVMEKYIRDSISQSSLSFTKDTQEKIALALIEGLNNGEGVAKIAKRIKSVYEEVLGVKTPGWRTERLARTEIIKISNEMTEAAYKQTGVVRKKEWFANPGHCGYCAALNGSVIQLGTSFVPLNGVIEEVNPSTGEPTGSTRMNSYEDVRHPPVHSNCRCTLIPVIER